MSDFIKFANPLLQVLRAHGGWTLSQIAKREVIKLSGISIEEAAETTKSGANRVTRNIEWTRLYLAKAGYITQDTENGIWQLTEKGETVSLPFSSDDLSNIVRNGRHARRNAPKMQILHNLRPGGHND